ncbi:MAG: hypothetical protein QG639_344, partial [Patescibacteria group bacterium]|nr:hypothetical protein [Patescibacteria group bacterium]
FQSTNRILIILLSSWILLGMVVAYWQHLNPTPFLYLSRLGLYLFFIVSQFSHPPKTKFLVRTLLIASGLYMVCFGLLQYYLLPDSRYLLLFGWDEHYYRLIGPLLDPNLSGILYVIIGWAIWGHRQYLPKKLWFGLLFLIGAAVVLTYSRATYLSVIVSVTFLLLHLNKQLLSFKKVAMFGLVVISAFTIYSLAPKPGGDGVNLLRTTSIEARLTSSTQYLSSLQGYQWITGTGLFSPLPQNTNALSHSQQPDNLLVLILVQTGIVGSLLFFMLFTKTYSRLRSSETATIAALIALLTHAQFNNSLFEPFIFLTMGILVATQQHQKTIKGSTQL